MCASPCLQESHASLQQQVAERQQQPGAATAEAGKLAAQRAALERQQARLGQEAAGLDRQLLERLGEQTFAEKGAQQTLREIEAARVVVQEREAAAEQLRATLEQLGSDTEATAAGNARLGATLAGLEAALADKAEGMAALEAEVKAGHADVEAKTRQLDALNRRYQRLLDGSRDVETGGWLRASGLLVRCGNADGGIWQHRLQLIHTFRWLRFIPPGCPTAPCLQARWRRLSPTCSERLLPRPLRGGSCSAGGSGCRASWWRCRRRMLSWQRLWAPCGRSRRSCNRSGRA